MFYWKGGVGGDLLGRGTEYKEESRCLPDVGQSNEKDEVPNS